MLSYFSQLAKICRAPHERRCLFFRGGPEEAGNWDGAACVCSQLCPLSVHPPPQQGEPRILPRKLEQSRTDKARQRALIRVAFLISDNPEKGSRPHTQSARFKERRSNKPIRRKLCARLIPCSRLYFWFAIGGGVMTASGQPAHTRSRRNGRQRPAGAHSPAGEGRLVGSWVARLCCLSRMPLLPTAPRRKSRVPASMSAFLQGATTTFRRAPRRI